MLSTQDQFSHDKAQAFAILSLLRATVRTAELVTVQAVYQETLTVDVRPLVLGVTDSGQSVAQTPIYGVPYLRIQGGLNAVICDPAVGDLGLVVVASRDSSAAVAARASATPPTDRAYSLSDAFYFGGFLNATPTQFVEFLPDGGGIKLVTPANITLQAGGDVSIISNALLHNGVNVGATHTHGGVTAGGASTNVPNP